MRAENQVVRAQVFVGWRQVHQETDSQSPKLERFPELCEDIAFGFMHQSETSNDFRIRTTVRTFFNFPQEREWG